MFKLFWKRILIVFFFFLLLTVLNWKKIFFSLHVPIICVSQTLWLGDYFRYLLFSMLEWHLLLCGISHSQLRFFRIYYCVYQLYFPEKSIFYFIHIFIPLLWGLFLGQYFINVTAAAKHKLCIFHIHFFVSKISR